MDNTIPFPFDRITASRRSDGPGILVRMPDRRPDPSTLVSRFVAAVRDEILNSELDRLRRQNDEMRQELLEYQRSERDRITLEKLTLEAHTVETADLRSERERLRAQVHALVRLIEQGDPSLHIESLAVLRNDGAEGV